MQREYIQRYDRKHPGDNSFTKQEQVEHQSGHIFQEVKFGILKMVSQEFAFSRLMLNYPLRKYSSACFLEDIKTIHQQNFEEKHFRAHMERNETHICTN